MKRFIIFFLALGLSAGFIYADDEEEETTSIGLSAWLEFGIVDINKADDREMWPYLMQVLTYDNSFFDGALDIYAEADYTAGLVKEPDEDVNWNSLYVDLFAGYNFSFGGASTLSFMLENEFEEIVFTPVYDGENAITGIVTPAVKFNQKFSFGGIYAQIGLPVTYTQYNKDADVTTWLDFKLGWKSNFGLGIYAKIYNQLSPDDNAGYLGLESIVSYGTGPVYFQVKLLFPHDFDGLDITPRYGDFFNHGVIITPRFEYYFKSFTFYAKCKIANIGVDGENIRISPALGVIYSF